MKKTSINRNKTLSVLGLTLGLAVAVLFPPHAFAGTTSSLQFNTQTKMVNTGVDSDARGSITVGMSGSAKGNNENLKISLAKLDPNAIYELVAYLGDDTNAVNIAEIVTDRKGSLTISYAVKVQGKLSPHTELLPVALDPLCNIRELDIVNGSLQTVLRAVLTSPDKGQYAARRVMSNTGFLPSAKGNLLMQGNSSSTQFRLQASGLAPNTDYRLALNGNPSPTITSDKAGKLNLKALPPGSPNLLDIQTVAVTDNSGINVILISGGLGIPCSTAAQATVNLRTAANFAVLAGAAVTSTGNTDVTGDLGVWAGSSVSGFQGVVTGGPGIVHGSIHAGDATAQIAQVDLTTAFNDAAGRTLAPVDVANADLGGRTLPPGLYKSTGTLALTGAVTLDAQGNVNAVWIFQIASSLNTATGSQVVLSGGAKASNVFWQVGTSATLATTTAFQGTIMADQSITLATGATLHGRALARIASVTMDSNAITLP
jgi:hypothetical protein